MKAKENIERLKRWVVRHRKFAMALPLILVLTSFFVVENVKDFQLGFAEKSKVSDGFNTELPGKVPTLEHDTDNEPWKMRDTLEAATVENSEEVPEMTKMTNSENDSLQKILKRLEGLSFESNQQEMVQAESPVVKKTVEREKKSEVSVEERRQKFVENRLAYREMLLEGKKKIIGESLSGNQYQQEEPKPTDKKPVFFRATIYGDQFILPNENVQLLLMEDMVYNDKRFAKNTFVYAMASINGNRVYLDIDNIEHHPVNLSVRDFNDGREGIYNTRAGELWREYKADMGNDAFRGATDEITNGAPNLVTDIARGLGSFLRKKKLREKEKILLMDDYELLLTEQ